ncbi:discoidin domain-containing protein [Pseudolysobacter antarcticus]|uniref:Discoidin domain-containing protein n=1 Tax=Pseudolysobacter antarcticus TaxID=2511995 RepID=A0A411HNP8_9GAMM|nr:discoidin domain-containing protein [Pseudolysobacter antarcticus]QBB72086.1 discoidin domain-containing protein [Pseudolysobacter antarcticus]
MAAPKKEGLTALAFLFAAATACVIGPATALACGTPQTQILSVGDTAKDRTCNFDTIQKAIDNATCPGTTILVTRQHTYTAQHLLIKNKSLLIAGASHCGKADSAALPPRTAIDGTGHLGDSVITITGQSYVVLQNLSIRGGTSYAAGGGISFDGKSGTLTLENALVTSNRAYYGGGIYMHSADGQLDIADNVLIDLNAAQQAGGGIEIEGNVHLSISGDNTSVYSNTVGDDSGLPNVGNVSGYGGGIAAFSPASIEINSPGILGFGGAAGAVQSNTGIFGGGIALLGENGCTASLQMYTLDPQIPAQINDNTASKQGGALYLSATASFAFKRNFDDIKTPCVPAKDQVDLHDFRLQGNSAADGAAIYLDGYKPPFYVSGDPPYPPQAVNTEGGAHLNLNGVSLNASGLSKRGARPCSPAIDCNVIEDNIAQTVDPKSGKPVRTDGATIAIGRGGTSARLFAERVTMRHNIGGNLINNNYDDGDSSGLYTNSVELHNCLLVDNNSSHALIAQQEQFIEPFDSSTLLIDSCTIANNSIGNNSVVLSISNRLDLTKSILSQPLNGPNDICVNCNLTFNVDNVLGENLFGLPGGATQLQTVPRFIDPANGNYRLQPISAALDFAIAGGSATDILGNPRSVDLGIVPNRFGPRDLGAYERQTNVAAATNGATASASSTFSALFPVASIIDGDHVGFNWANGGGWNDASSGLFPDFVQINFNASRSINQIVVYTLQDNFAAPIEPSDTMTFASFGLTAFDIQVLDPATSTWVTVQSITGNHLVKRTVFLPTFKTTSAIRVVGRASADAQYSRIVEVEVFGS